MTVLAFPAANPRAAEPQPEGEVLPKGKPMKPEGTS